MNKIIFITGATRSGKSTLAVDLARKRRGRVVFIATGAAGDAEMRRRIAKHKADRPPHWRTVEEQIDLAGAVAGAGSAPAVIVDCLTLWISNLMCRRKKEAEILSLTDRFLDAARSGSRTVIVVSNEVGWGVVPVNRTARLFRDIVGRVHRRVAAESDEVYLAVAGLPLRIKPAAHG